MNVQIHVRQLRQLPPIQGPHELSWSYLLDAVFADAYQAGVTRLVCYLPSAELADGVTLRADLTRPRRGAVGGTAIADLAGQGVVDPEAERLYRLSFGVLAPRGLRSLPDSTAASGEPQSVLSVFTLRARLCGLPLRAYALSRSLRRYDRATVAMRQRFSWAGKAPAFYHLSIWGAG